MKEMEVETWHMWKNSKGAIDKRFRVMAKPGGRLSHPPPLKHNDRGGEMGGGGGVSAQGEKERRESRQTSAEARSKMESSKSWRTKKA